MMSALPSSPHQSLKVVGEKVGTNQNSMLWIAPGKNDGQGEIKEVLLASPSEKSLPPDNGLLKLCYLVI